tara:strand:- start:1773 stop:2630 length:858 start_codon:yes stop_codon:yes gene_type:complete
MARQKTIPYLIGYSVKPASVTPLGEVFFTDGTNALRPNQQQCEAYGYTYNHETGTCSVYTFSSQLETSLRNENNYLGGAGNTTETGTNNTYIMGENNTVRGFSRNNIIIGNQNEIANGVNNTNVFGTLGEATADNSIVLGCNAGTDNLGERQSIQLMYGRQTTNGVSKYSYLNNTTDSYFEVPTDTVMYFHADIVTVRVGGSAGAGAVGDYASWVERGVVINKSGTLSINRERDTIKSSGTVTNWLPTGIVVGTTFVMRVRGQTDMTLEWNSNITFTQIKTGVAL